MELLTPLFCFRNGHRPGCTKVTLGCASFPPAPGLYPGDPFVLLKACKSHIIIENFRAVVKPLFKCCISIYKLHFLFLRFFGKAVHFQMQLELKHEFKIKIMANYKISIHAPFSTTYEPIVVIIFKQRDRFLSRVHFNLLAFNKKHFSL